MYLRHRGTPLTSHRLLAGGRSGNAPSSCLYTPITLGWCSRASWAPFANAAIVEVVVFRDTHHLSRTFAISLAPAVARELDRLGL